MAKATLKVMVETLAARGWTAGKIAGHLGMSDEYARQLHRNATNSISTVDQYLPDEEDHARHVTRCLAEGGFPAAEIVGGLCVYLAHDGRLWTHRKRVGRG